MDSPDDPKQHTIQIQSTIFQFPQLTGQTDRPTDGIGDKTCNNTRLLSINHNDAVVCWTWLEKK